MEFTAAESNEASGSGEEVRAAQWPVWLFRVAATAAAVMLFDQAVFAGQFLNGQFGSLLAHRENATYAGVSVGVLLVAAVLLRWPGRRAWQPFLVCGLIAIGIPVQILAGFNQWLSVHVPLGVAMIAAALGVAAWAWRGLR